MKYFRKEEFACGCGCGRLKIDPDFADMMDEARLKAKRPFIINSGYRCPTYNISVGGSKNSAHIHGKAADIQCTTSLDRYAIVTGCLAAGFNRIGIGSDFVHVDSDESKAEVVIWTYYNK